MTITLVCLPIGFELRSYRRQTVDAGLRSYNSQMVDVLPLSFRLDLEQNDMKRVFADWCHKHQPNLRCLPLIE